MTSTVVLGSSTRAALAAHISARTGLETGGILVGSSLGNFIVITKASPPGPKAKHTARTFRRDTAFAQRWLDREYERTDGAVDYLGEWHVHSALDAPPSLVDRASLWKIALSFRYRTRRPLLLIVENQPPAVRRHRVYEFAADPRRMAELAVVRREISSNVVDEVA